MQTKTLKYFLLVAIISLLNASAQPFTIKKYTVNDGLPENNILCVYQDSYGFLWIGTTAGLSRFDGKEFVNYGLDNGLPHLVVDDIYEDHLHRLWIGTRNGVAQMKGKQCITFPYNDKQNIGYVFSIREIQNKLWALTNKGIYQFETHYWKKITLYPGTKDSACRSIIQTSRGLLINYGHIIVLKKANGTLERLTKYHTSGTYYDCLKKQQNRLLLSTPEGLFKSENNKFLPLFKDYLLNKRINQYSLDSKDRFWISTFEKGLYVSPAGNSENLVYKIPLTVNLISSIYEDKDGIIWIASWEGLLKIEQRDYEVYDKNQNKKIDGVRNIIVTPGNNIIATSEKNGFLLFNNGVFKPMHLHYVSSIASAIAKEAVDSYCFDDSDHLWAATRKFKLFEIKKDSVKNVLHNIAREEGYLNITFNKTNKKIYMCADTLLEGDEHGFYKFVSQNQHQYILEPQNIHYFPNGRMLITTRFNGILLVDEKQNCFDITNQMNIPKNAIGINFIEDSSGKFWVYYYGGIKRYYWDSDKLPVEEISIGTKDGLPNEHVFGMTFDKRHQLWAATLSGIIVLKFDANNEDFSINYLSEDENIDYNISNENWRASTITTDSSGNVWFQMFDQIVKFDPSNMNFVHDPPGVVIDDLQINFKETNWLKWTDSLMGYLQLPHQPVLTYDQNNLYIKYTGISFNEASGLQYSYKLEGANNNWSLPTTNNSVSFVKLPPGKYNFEVKARKPNSPWSNPATFSFIILKPFWETWWFISLLIFVIAAAIYALFQFRLQQKLKVFHVRQKLHRDLHDDVGATLSSIKIYSEVLQNNGGNGLISGLIKTNAEDMIDKLEIIAWATDPQHDSFKSFKETIVKHASSLCHAKNINLNIQVDGLNENTMMPGDVRQNLFLIFKEAINNIIKYAEASECIIQMFIKGHKFYFLISDNGKGFSGAIKGSGNGWKNMKKRAQELNGTIKIQSEPNKGTFIDVSVPYPFKIPSFWDNKKATL